MRIEKFISTLLFIGLSFSLSFIYFAQERIYIRYYFEDTPLGPERYLRILAVIFIFLTVIFSMFSAKKHYHFSIYFSYLLLLVYIVLNYLISGADITNMTQFMDKKGIGTWVCLGLIFVSYNEQRFLVLKKFLVFSAIVVSCLTIYNYIDFGIGTWRTQSISKYRVYAVTLIWLIPYIFLITKGQPKMKVIRIFLLLVGISSALVIQTRSFLIIYFLTLVFDFFHTQKKHIYIILSTIGLIACSYVILSTEILSNSLEMLQDRGDSDTRTGQLQTFFNQLDFFDVIVGEGFFASYNLFGVEYKHVDNQWIYLFWWGGLLPFLSYFFLTAIVPIQVAFSKNLSYETKVECFVLILWVLALGGLAIFTTMSVEFYFFAISILLGRVLFKYSKFKRNQWATIQ